jgi:hypothetical protein
MRIHDIQRRQNFISFIPIFKTKTFVKWRHMTYVSAKIFEF